MAELIGGSALIRWMHPYGTQVLSSDFRKFDQDETVGLVDLSAGNDTSRTYAITLKDGKATGEFVFQQDAAGTTLWGAVDKGASGTLEWSPQGSATGRPKSSVAAIVMSRKKTVPYEEIVAITVDWQFNGAVTDTVY